MKITEITSFDESLYHSVVKLLPQLGKETMIPSRDHFEGILKSPATHFFVLEEEDKEVSGIMTLCIFDIPTGTKAWIEDVVVDESRRGKGFGKELVLFGIEYARSKGAKAVDLTSRPSRIAANSLYRKIGFIIRKTNLYRYQLG